MIYLRKLFTQDLRDGKQIAFPKDPSHNFFNFHFENGDPDRQISFVFNSEGSGYSQFNGRTISTRLYCARSESRMDGQVKAFLKDELHAAVDDIVVFKNRDNNYSDFEFFFIKKGTPAYPVLVSVMYAPKHSVMQEQDSNSNDITDENGYNKIFYGAPGTGKSHTVENNYVKGHKCFRITFHPDTDYTSFVGCYKPTMKPVADKPGEEEISYSFVPQVFLNAYVYSWNNPDKKTYLVIEELNRGNCAQIFGDVFQLLDRRVDDYPGFSKYKINADTDIAKHLKKHITNEDGSYENKIKEIYGLDEFDFSVMAIPDNLYILATMNTSDQSLFPIDSAFKRRWEWEYIDVNYSDASQFSLKIDNGHIYNWSQLLFGLNSYIKAETHNTNKILGNRFVQAGADKIISAKSFRDKVLFFLFNDVFKDDDDFRAAFFGENAEDRFFEDLCVSNDTELTIKFIENICGAQNIVPAETPAEETTETATE